VRKVEVRFKSGTTDYSSNGYASNHPKFAFVSKFENKKVRLLTSFQTCREYLCQQFLKRVRRSWPTNSWASEVDGRRVRLATYVSCAGVTKAKMDDARKVAENKMKVVAKMLNLIEKEANWPLSKVYVLTNPTMHPSIFMFMFVGSSKWLRSQHMLSLYSLLIRCIYMNPHFSRIRAYSGLVKVADKYRTGEYVAKGAQQRTDIGWFRNFHSYLAILKNFDTIFKGFPMSRNYSVKAIGSQDAAFCDGIAALLSPGNGKDKDLKKRVRDAITNSGK